MMYYRISKNEKNLFFGKKNRPGVGSDLKMLILILRYFFMFSFFHLYIIHIDIFGASVKEFLATTCLRILKFGTKIDSDELYCVTKRKKPHIAYQSLYLFIFLSLQ